MVIRGAAGSEICATVPTPIPLGSGKHSNALGGMWSGSVSSIPGTGTPRLVGGRGVAELAVVDAACTPVQAAAPSMVLTHPDSTAITTKPADASAAQKNLDGISVT
jgi:hypothetical protein